MIKHVGKHGGKRVIVLYRTVPGEDHMALVTYADTLPRHIHDDIMKALESDSGQQAKEFSDYLFRYTLVNGENALETLHREGMIKKVNTNQIIVTPDAKNNVRLDELNEILRKMDLGEEAIKEMAALDKDSGMSGRTKRNNVTEGKELRVPLASRTQAVQVGNNISIDNVLTDDQLATQRLAQSAQMQKEAKALLAEADRLQKEAEALTGATTTKNATRKTTKAKAKA